MGIYYFFKYYPPFFNLRLNLLNPSVARLIKSENQLFDKVLPAGRMNCVFDGGANVGNLTSYFEKNLRK